jgi:hypothetical protein
MHTSGDRREQESQRLGERLEIGSEQISSEFCLPCNSGRWYWGGSGRSYWGIRRGEKSLDDEEKMA